MNQDMIREARRIIAEVSRAPELSRRQVEGLLGVQLVHSSDARPDLRYYQAQLPSGPFARIELREPNPQQNQDWRLLVLEARDSVSGTLLGRVVDHRTAREGTKGTQLSDVRRTTTVSNNFWFDTAFRRWAATCVKEFETAKKS